IPPQHTMKISLPLVLLLLTAPSFLIPAFSQTNTTSQQFQQPAELAKTEINNDQLHRIDSLLQSFIDQKKTNSIAAFAAKNGVVIYKNAVGWKDVENRVPASIDDYYVMFSQTKAVTTVAFMTL